MDKENENLLIKSRIKFFLKKKHMTITELSSKSNVPYSTIAGILNSGKIPTITIIRKVSKGFGISTTDFLNFEPYNKNSQSLEDTIEDYFREEEYRKFIEEEKVKQYQREKHPNFENSEDITEIKHEIYQINQKLIQILNK